MEKECSCSEEKRTRQFCFCYFNFSTQSLPYEESLNEKKNLLNIRCTVCETKRQFQILSYIHSIYTCLCYYLYKLLNINYLFIIIIIIEVE